MYADSVELQPPCAGVHSQHVENVPDPVKRQREHHSITGNHKEELNGRKKYYHSVPPDSQQLVTTENYHRKEDKINGCTIDLSMVVPELLECIN